MIGSLMTPMGLGIILSWRDQATRGMKQAEGSLRGLQRQAEKTTEQVARQAEQLGQQYQRHARNAKIGLVAMGVGAAVLAPLGLAAKEAVDLEDQVGKLRGLLTAKGIGGEEKDMWAARFADSIKNVGVNTRVAFDQVKAASYGIVSGLENMNAVGPALQRSADLAVAANGDIAATSNAIINTMNTFGKKWGDTMTEVEKTDRIFAVMTNIVGRYKTDVNELSAAMAYATPNASMLGQSLEGTAAAVATLQTKGIQGARAGTTYAMMLRGLLQLTSKFKDETVDAKAATMDLDEFFDSYSKAAKTGGLEKKDNIFAQLKFRDANDQMLETWEIVRNMEELLGLTKEQAVALKKNVEEGSMSMEEAYTDVGVPVAIVTQLLEAMGEEPMRGWAIMLGESEQLREAAAMAGDLDAALKSLNDAQTTTAGLWAMSKNAMTIIMGDIGEQFLPILKSISRHLIEAGLWLRAFFKVYPSAAKWIAWGTAALGALLLVGGALFSIYSVLMMIKTAAAIQALAAASGAAIPSMMGLGIAAKIAAAATWVFNAALWGCPIVWIVAGVLAAAAGVYLLVKYWDQVVAALRSAWGWLVNIFNSIPTWVFVVVGLLGLMVSPILVAVAAVALMIRYWKQIKAVIQAIPTWVWIVAGAIGFIVFGPIAALIAGLALVIKHWGWVKQAGIDAWGWIKQAAKDTWDWLKGFWDWIVGLWDLFIEAAKMAFDQIMNFPPVKAYLELVAPLAEIRDQAIKWLFNTGETAERVKVGHYDIPIGPGMPGMAGAGAGGGSTNTTTQTVNIYPPEGTSEIAIGNQTYKQFKKMQDDEKRRDTDAKA